MAQPVTHSSGASATPRPARSTFLPFALPHITQAEIDEVTDTLRSGWIAAGPKVKRFEREFAEALGVSHAVAMSSATAALHIALEVVGVTSGDEVLVPVYTFTSSAAVIAHCGATPVLVDIDGDSFNIDPEKLEAAITPRTKAIVVVHFAGLPAEMDTILDVGRRHGLPIIEDAAHALPTLYKGRMIGALGDLTAFSFYATKTLATGDGGMLVTNNQAWAERAGIMAMHGISRDAWKRYTAEGSWFYEVIDAGYKYNMTDIVAALGLQQLARRQWLLQRRQSIAAVYNAAFTGVEELEIPPDRVDCQHAWHLYALRIRPERLTITRDDFIKELTAANIGTSVHFIPLHLHPYYRDTYALAPEDFPVALSTYQREISLPIYPSMTEDDVQDVVAAVRRTVEQRRK
jgi:dTDP-4-amino-4,6-dideoxygalactose transaminase